jgi:hypothetical protein
MISVRRENVAKAAAELLLLRSLNNVADGLCRSHSQQDMHVIHSRLHNEELILLGPAHFKNLPFDDWCELFSENMFSVLGWPHQMEIEPVAGGSMYGFVAGRFHTAWWK